MKKLNAPIPGQSLLSTPGNAPYERPPEMNRPEEVAMFYMEKMEDPKKVTAAIDALEMGLTVKDLTTGMLRASVSEGIHSIDVSLIVAPILHEQISSVAKAAGIEFDEGLEEEEDRTGIDYAIDKHKTRKLIKQTKEESGKEVEEVPEFKSQRGLMSPVVEEEV